MAQGAKLDDLAIEDLDELYRRIPVQQIVRDENGRNPRPSSACFDDHPSGTSLSVNIGSVLREHSLAPEFTLIGHETTHCLVVFNVGNARQYELGVTKAPIAGNQAHGHVNGKKTKSVKRKLARASRWFIEPH